MGKSLGGLDAWEFEVQALLYAGLSAMGYRVRGEVPSKTAFPDKIVIWNRKGAQVEKKARFDLVVFGKDWKPLSIIETKHSDYSIDFYESKQCKRYQKYGVKVEFAMNFGSAIRILKAYKANLENYMIHHGPEERREFIPKALLECIDMPWPVVDGHHVRRNESPRNHGWRGCRLPMVATTEPARRTGADSAPTKLETRETET